jgi:hypothetical protein
VRPPVALLLTLVAAAIAAVSAVGATGRLAAPDPCAISQGALNAALAASAGTPQYGTPGTKAVRGASLTTCTWTYGNKEVVTSIGPKSVNAHPPTNPAGTVTHRISGLGSAGKLLTNSRAGYVFIAVTFTKGARWGEAWGSLGVTKAQILRVGRSLYSKL